MKTKEGLASEYAEKRLDENEQEYYHSSRVDDYIQDSFLAGYRVASREVEELKAKLEKTVDALEFYEKRDNVMPIEISPAKEALKAIKGE